MPVAHSDLPAALKTAHQALFHREFKAAMALQGWQSFTTMTRLQGKDRATYHWFGTPPKPANVNHGELSFGDLKKYSYTMVDDLHKVGVEVDRRALEDDDLTLITPRIQQLALSFAQYRGELLLDQLNDNPTAYDSTALFSTSRTIGDSGTINNALTVAAATGTTPTVAEMQTAFSTARQTMAAYKDDRGRVENVVPDTVVYPAAHEQTVFQALNGANTPGSVNLVVPGGQGGASNINGYNLFRNPNSDNADEMFFLYTGGVAKPLIEQMRLEPRMEINDDPNSVWAIEKDSFLYSARGRFTQGVGEPRHIIRVTFT